MRVAAVLLAAGSSERFGAGNKLLADIAGEPLIRRVARQLSLSTISEMIIITGPDREAIAAAVAGFDLKFQHNAAHLAGMGRSIATGIQALSPETDGALVVPGDMPALTASLVDRLIASFEESGGVHIVHPVAADSSQRNPVVWPRRCFAMLAALDGAHGAKSLIAADALARVTISVEDEAQVLDIDTPQDLAQLGAKS